MSNKKLFNLFIAIIFAASMSPVSAQSGRVVQIPETKPRQTPSSEIAPSEQPDVRTDIVSAGGDKYQLVYAPSYKGKLRFSTKEKAEMDQTRRSSLDNFTEQLNKAGELSYQLISALDGEVVLVKLDEIEHQYDWFETISSFYFAKEDFQKKLEEVSKKRFRVINHSLLSRSCEPLYPDEISLGEKCEYVDLFLLEKERDVKKPIEQILVGSFPGWGRKPSDELEKQIDEKLAEGFYPISVFSRFEILLEKTKDRDDLSGNKPDVRVVRSSWGQSGFENKVNELAKQGYRLAMTNNGIAVMSRKRETAQIPVSYIWVKADKKSFEKDLAKLQARGAIYRTTYPNVRGRENTLIFEQKIKDDGKRAEFRVLKFDFDVKENQTEGKVYVDLTPAAKEAVKTMNALAAEGFQARDLFYTDQVSVILERIN